MHGGPDYRDALAALARSVDLDALVERSRLHEQLGDYPAARADAERAVAVAAEPRQRAVALARLAGVARAEGAPGDALQLAAGVDAPEAQLEYAWALQELGRADEAAEAFRSVRAGDPRVRLAVRVGAGAVARDRGHYDGARRELLIALAEAEAGFGARSLEAAEVLNELGMVCKYAARFEEGIDLYRRALAILERAVGEEHPDVASVYHNLGGLEHARGNFERAEPYARRSVELRRRTLGAEHPAVAEDEAALASILLALRRDEEAERLLRDSIGVLERSRGAAHPEVAAAWNNLGSILLNRGDLDGAEGAYRHALEAKETLLGQDHPATAITLNNLAVVARRRGKTGEAEETYQRALAILEGRVETDHPSLERTRANYAKLLNALGRGAEADALEREERGAPARLEDSTNQMEDAT